MFCYGPVILTQFNAGQVTYTHFNFKISFESSNSLYKNWANFFLLLHFLSTLPIVFDGLDNLNTQNILMWEGTLIVCNMNVENKRALEYI